MKFRPLAVSFSALAALSFAAAGTALSQAPPTPPPLSASPAPVVTLAPQIVPSPALPTPPPALAPGPTGTVPAEEAPVSRPSIVPPGLSTPPPPAPLPTPPSGPVRGTRTGPNGKPVPNPSPSATPTPAAFTTLDGVWEVEEQPYTSPRTIYTHLLLAQHGTAVSGTWLHGRNERTPVTGTYDGHLITLTVAGGSASFSGYVENNEDMVGMLKEGTSDTAFTAEHRKKEKV